MAAAALTQAAPGATPPRVTGGSQLAVVGAVAGLMSGLLGVGGGVVTVPLLVVWLRWDQRTAHAVSLAAIIPISIGGVLRLGAAGTIRWSFAGALIIGALAGTAVGARQLSHIDEDVLRVIFGLFLVLVAAILVIGS